MRDLPRKSKAIILLSGGIDSATTLYFAKKYGYKLWALIFDYNQRHKKEVNCAVEIAELNHINYSVVKIDFPWAESALTRKDVRVPLDRDLSKKDKPFTYVAGRNIVFLSYAASLAESVKAEKIFIGAHVQDYSGYPDCRPQFLSAMTVAINAGIFSKGIEVVSPLIDKTKREIIALGKNLGVPFEYTWSCYIGQAYPCGRCDSCRFRMDGFKKIGMTDPLLNHRRPKKNTAVSAISTPGAET